MSSQTALKINSLGVLTFESVTTTISAALIGCHLLFVTSPSRLGRPTSNETEEVVSALTASAALLATGLVLEQE